MRLMDLFELDGQLPEGAGALLPEGALPPEMETRVLAKVLEQTGQAPRGKGEKTTMKRSKFGLALLAAALCLGTVAASAAVYFRADRGIAQSLGAESESWQEFLDGSGTAIQATQECKGWTLTVNQAVGDRNCAYLLLDLTAPEGTVLGADLYRLDCRLEFDGATGGSWGCQMQEDEDRTDNRLSFLLSTTMDGDLRDTTGHLKAAGIVEIFENGEGAEDDLVNRPADLEWSFDFPLRYKNDPIVYRVDRTIPVEQVELTPLSVRVRLSGKKELLRRVEPVTGGTPAEDAILLEVRDKDGSRYTVNSSGGRESLGTLTEVMTFVPIIHPERVAALVLDGVEIPLTEE